MLPPSEVVQRCTPLLNLPTLYALSRTSRQLRDHALAAISQHEQLATQWLHEAIEASNWGSYASRLSQATRLHNIKWLIHQCCKLWGIITVAVRLDLQGALLLAKGHRTLVNTLIEAGARITQRFILTATQQQSSTPAAWIAAYKRQGLSTGLCPLLEAVCLGQTPAPAALAGPSKAPQPFLIPADARGRDLLTAAAVALSQGKQTLLPRILSLPQAQRWTAPEVSHLLTLALNCSHSKAVVNSSLYTTISLLRLRGAKALEKHAKLLYIGQATAHGFSKLPIRKLLGEELSAADLQMILQQSIAAMATSSSSTSRRQDAQSAMVRLIDGSSRTAAAAAEGLPPAAIQQLTEAAISMGLSKVVTALVELPAAATIAPEAAGKLLLQVAKAGVDWAMVYGWDGDVPAAVLTLPVLQQLLQLYAGGEVLDNNCYYEHEDEEEEHEDDDEDKLCWGCRLFKLLADTGVAQLLPLDGKLDFIKAAGGHRRAMGRVLELLQQEQHSKEDLMCLLKGLINHAPQALYHPVDDFLDQQQSAQQLPLYKLQELLQLAVGEKHSSILGPLLKLPSARTLLRYDLEQLLKSCWEHGDSSEMVSTIVESGVPALKELNSAAVAALVMDAGKRPAAKCAKELLELLPVHSLLKQRDLDGMLPVVITTPCDGEMNEYAWFKDRGGTTAAAGCTVCQLIENARDKAVVKALLAAIGSADEQLHHQAALFDRCWDSSWTDDDVVPLLLAAVSSASTTTSTVEAAAAAATGALAGATATGAAAGAAAAGGAAAGAAAKTAARTAAGAAIMPVGLSSCRYAKVQQLVEMLNRCSDVTRAGKELVLDEAVKSAVHDGGAALSALIQSSSDFILVAAFGVKRLIEQALKCRSMAALSLLLQLPAARELEGPHVMQLMGAAVRYGAVEGVMLLLQLPRADPAMRAAAMEKLQEVVRGL